MIELLVALVGLVGTVCSYGLLWHGLSSSIQATATERSSAIGRLMKIGAMSIFLGLVVAMVVTFLTEDLVGGWAARNDFFVLFGYLTVFVFAPSFGIIVLQGRRLVHGPVPTTPTTPEEHRD